MPAFSFLLLLLLFMPLIYFVYILSDWTLLVLLEIFFIVAFSSLIASWHLLLNQGLFRLFGVAVLGIQSIAMKFSILVKYSIVSLFGSLCISFSSNFSHLALFYFQWGVFFSGRFRVIWKNWEVIATTGVFVYLRREVNIDRLFTYG